MRAMKGDADAAADPDLAALAADAAAGEIEAAIGAFDGHEVADAEQFGQARG